MTNKLKMKRLALSTVLWLVTTAKVNAARETDAQTQQQRHVRSSRKRRLLRQEQQQDLYQHTHQRLPPPPRMKESVEQLLVANGWLSSSLSSSSSSFASTSSTVSLITSIQTPGFGSEFLGTTTTSTTAGSDGTRNDDDDDDALSCESYYEQYQLTLRNEMDGLSLDALRANNNNNNNGLFQPRDTSIVLLDQYRAGLLPFVYKIFIDNNQKNPEPEYFGPNGEYTDEFQVRYPQMQAFWQDRMMSRGNDQNHGDGGGAGDSGSSVVWTNHSILLGAHGSILADATALRQSLDFMFEFNNDEVYTNNNNESEQSSSSNTATTMSGLDQAVALVQNLIETHVPGGYNNPLLTLNAFAHPANPKYNTLDTVVIGDGALQAIAQANHQIALHQKVAVPVSSPNSNSSGSQDDDDDDMDLISLHQANFVLAHEFSHILQFRAGIRADNVIAVATTVGESDNNVVVNATSTALAVPMTTSLSPQQQQDHAPLRNANYELLADALASYFLAHPQGARFNVSWIQSWVAVAYAFGGCNSTKETFHGTPRQRSCVATWGAKLALSSSEDSDDDSAKLSFDDLVHKFRQDLPLLLALDDSVCGFPDSTGNNADMLRDEELDLDPTSTVADQQGEHEISDKEENGEVTLVAVSEAEDELDKEGENDEAILEPPPSLSAAVDATTSAATGLSFRWNFLSWTAISMIGLSYY